MRVSGNRSVVPAFFHQEVLNALVMGERRNRVTEAASREFTADILKAPFPVSPDADLVDWAFSTVVGRVSA